MEGRVTMLYENPIPRLPDDAASGKGRQQSDVLQKGYPMYENIYFAFIDVLGFRKTFDENRNAPRQFGKGYENVFDYFSQLLLNAKFIGKGNAIPSHAGQTSDSLYFYTDRSDYLAEFIKIYLHFSLYAMSKNVFFRGGIAKGCLFVKEPYQFYGDCVIKAYLLEENIAKYPHVLLDEDTFKAMKDIPDLHGVLQAENGTGRYSLKPFIRVTKNELAAITNLDLLQIQIVEKKSVLKNIRDGEKRFEFDERNYPKYHFLAQEIEKLDKFDDIFE